MFHCTDNVNNVNKLLNNVTHPTPHINTTHVSVMTFSSQKYIPSLNLEATTAGIQMHIQSK